MRIGWSVDEIENTGKELDFDMDLSRPPVGGREKGPRLSPPA
jgi:hypothetical protein